MRSDRSRKPRPPLDDAALRDLALAYVGRFATSRAKLKAYLQRKLRERGWAEAGGPPVDTIVERIAELGYVDDAAFALSKARSLTQRGYGGRRVGQALRQAGISDDDGEGARALALAEAAESALRFARRRAIGPFAKVDADRAVRERWLAAMIRAGHDLALARRIILWPRGIEPDPEQLLS